MYTCMYIYIYTHTYVCIYIYIYIYTYIYQQINNICMSAEGLRRFKLFKQHTLTIEGNQSL